VIGDSAAGGVVSISKEGAGTWVLTGANTYSGDTSVVDGTLSITNAFLHDDSEVRLFTEDNDENSTSPELNLDFVGTDTVAGLFFDGSAQDEGLWGAVGNGAAQFTSSLITGSGLLNVVAPMGGELLASTVPEPTAAMLMMLAVGMGSLARKRR
jgi:autotransporter-associated beta strand protein